MGAKPGINLKGQTYGMISKKLMKRILPQKRQGVSGRKAELYDTNLQFIATLHKYHDDKMKANYMEDAQSKNEDDNAVEKPDGKGSFTRFRLLK